MVCKRDSPTFMSEFESQWVPHSYRCVPHLSIQFLYRIILELMRASKEKISSIEKLHSKYKH